MLRPFLTVARPSTACLVIGLFIHPTLAESSNLPPNISGKVALPTRQILSARPRCATPTTQGLQSKFLQARPCTAGTKLYTVRGYSVCIAPLGHGVMAELGSSTGCGPVVIFAEVNGGGTNQMKLGTGVNTQSHSVC